MMNINLVTYGLRTLHAHDKSEKHDCIFISYNLSDRKFPDAFELLLLDIDVCPTKQLK